MPIANKEFFSAKKKGKKMHKMMHYEPYSYET